MRLLNQTLYKSRCRFSLDNEPNGFGTMTFRENKCNDNNHYYVKTDYLNIFWEKYRPQTEYILYSGRSDINVDERYLHILNDPNLKAWYCQNRNIEHKKLGGIPIGLMDPWWYIDGYSEYGNNDMVLFYTDRPKTENIYMNFKVNNNISERLACATAAFSIGVAESGDGLNSKKYSTYLDELSKHRFCLCPTGNGLDTHRFWESIYVKTVPIMVKSLFTTFWNKGRFPMIEINSWEDLRNEKLDEERYETILPNFSQFYASMGICGTDYTRYMA